MRIRAAALALTCLLHAGALRADCTVTYPFANEITCKKNRDAIVSMASALGNSFINECESALTSCPSSSCAIKIQMSDGTDPVCQTLVQLLDAGHAKAEPILCEIAVDGKSFGKVYAESDGSLHLSFTTPTTATGQSRYVNVALSGKDSGPGLHLPDGAKKCSSANRISDWACTSTTGNPDLSCTQRDLRFPKGVGHVKFQFAGGSCDEASQYLQQTAGILNVATCLTTDPKAPPESAAQTGLSGPRDPATGGDGGALPGM